MTKKEAIKLLSWVLNEGTISEDLEYHGVSVKDALKIAIKALKQESIEEEKVFLYKQRDKRYISRKALEEAMDVFNQKNFTLGTVNFTKTAEKTGEWVYTGDYITEGMLKCSECGFEHDVSERFLYCPNCGTRMEEAD